MAEIKLIPFNKTGNVCNMLDFDDYMNAMTDEGELIFGFSRVIHMNPKYPQYHSVRYCEKYPDELMVFTGKGWERCKMEDILPQLREEARQCATYINNNIHNILKIAEEKKKIIIAQQNIGKIHLNSPTENKSNAKRAKS